MNAGLKEGRKLHASYRGGKPFSKHHRRSSRAGRVSDFGVLRGRRPTPSEGRNQYRENLRLHLVPDAFPRHCLERAVGHESGTTLPRLRRVSWGKGLLQSARAYVQRTVRVLGFVGHTEARPTDEIIDGFGEGRLFRSLVLWKGYSTLVACYALPA